MTVRPSRKTWIWGRSASSTAKIHYPPVIPWVRPELRGQMIDLFIRAASQGTNGLEAERIDLESTLRDLEARSVLSAVERRKLHQAHKRLEQVQQELDTHSSKHMDRARAEAANFCLIRGIREAAVIHDAGRGRGYLRLITAPIKINRALLGTYDIWIDPLRSVPSSAIKVVRRDRIAREGPHPHWNGGPCFGTWGPVLQSFMKRGAWSALAGGLLNYLAIYDAGSPLIPLEDFYTGERYENKDPLR
jgi:hypothetical protein